MIKRALTAITIVIGMTTAPAWGEEATKDSGEADRAIVSEAGELIAQKQPARALEVLAPVLTSFDKLIADAQAKGLAFCGTSLMESILYSGISAEQKKDGVVFGPEVCDAYFTQSYALIDLGRKEEGLAVLQQLTALAPMHGHYFVELGYAYRINGHDEKAEEAYRTALQHAELAENDAAKKRVRAMARRGIGYMLVEKGDLDGAEKEYRQSLKDDPDNPVAKAELTFIAQHRKK